MANAVREQVNEKVEFVAKQIKGEKKKGSKLWLTIPVGVVLAFSAFLVVRRFFAPGDED